MNYDADEIALNRQERELAQLKAQKQKMETELKAKEMKKQLPLVAVTSHTHTHTPAAVPAAVPAPSAPAAVVASPPRFSITEASHTQADPNAPPLGFDPSAAPPSF